MTPVIRLLQSMSRLNLSGYAVQKRFGLSKGTVTNWRKGTYQPRMSFLKKYCEEYSVNINWILTGEGDTILKNLNSNDQEFIRKIDMIKRETGLTNKEIAVKLGAYPTILSELRAGKTSVRPQWWNIIEKEYGFIWNDLDAKKELFKLRQEIEKIKSALLLINIQI